MSNSFSKRIRLVLETRGITQKKVCQSLHISSGGMSQYVTGKHEPSYDVLCALCKLLDVSADYLLGLSDQMQQHSEIPVKENRIEFFNRFIRGNVPRDPLSDLDDDLRQRAEGYIEALQDIQRDRFRQDTASSRFGSTSA